MPEYDTIKEGTLLSAFYAGEPASKTTIALVDEQLFDVMDPSTWVFNLDTIATSLANLCRFNGHIRNFYSVAEHAVRVSKMMERWGYDKLAQYIALHHDDMESILGDCPSPHKRITAIAGEPFKEMEETLEYAYFNTLGISVNRAFNDTWSVVKEADLAVYLEERDERPIVGQGLYPNLAKDQYLKRHHDLNTALVAEGAVNAF